MTWDQVLPVATLVIGYAGSQYSERRKERHERERIVLQRAADVEGQAMLELQELLVRLPDEWLSVSHATSRATDVGGADAYEAYEATVEAAKPWQRAQMLSSRIVDSSLRRIVDDAIDLAYPYDDVDLPRMFAGAGDEFPDYPYRGAELQVRGAVRSIGDRLRQPIEYSARGHSWRPWYSWRRWYPWSP